MSNFEALLVPPRSRFLHQTIDLGLRYILVQESGSRLEVCSRKTTFKISKISSCATTQEAIFCDFEGLFWKGSRGRRVKILSASRRGDQGLQNAARILLLRPREPFQKWTSKSQKMASCVVAHDEILQIEKVDFWVGSRPSLNPIFGRKCRGRRDLHFKPLRPIWEAREVLQNWTSKNGQNFNKFY